MVEFTDAVQHRHWLDRSMPPVKQVRDGLWSLPVPMPGTHGLRYLLAYVLELPDGIALIDTGWSSEEAWQALVDGLAGIGFALRHVRAVLATHIHTDHYGLAGRIREASGAWLALHPADAAWSQTDSPTELSNWREKRGRLGIPQPPRQAERPARPLPWHHTYQTKPDVLLGDGELMDLPGWRLRAVWTPGHSPGHMCFHAEDLGLLFGGDHVLPKVTPHIAVTSMQRADPLGDYLRSLESVAALEVAEVLPAHEYRYTGLRERAEELIAYHRARLIEIEERLAGTPDMSCWELTKVLTWSRPLESHPPQLRRMAIRETHAHLVLLAGQNRIEKAGDRPERWRVRAC